MSHEGRNIYGIFACTRCGKETWQFLNQYDGVNVRIPCRILYFSLKLHVLHVYLFSFHTCYMLCAFHSPSFAALILFLKWYIKWSSSAGTFTHVSGQELGKVKERRLRILELYPLLKQSLPYVEFNDALCSSNYILSNGRLISER
jgi:hypothetical protein